MTSSDRFPVPVRSAVKSNLTDWCYQNLPKRALNALTVQASTTKLGKLFQIFTMRAEKKCYQLTTDLSDFRRQLLAVLQIDLRSCHIPGYLLLLLCSVYVSVIRMTNRRLHTPVTILTKTNPTSRLHYFGLDNASKIMRWL